MTWMIWGTPPFLETSILTASIYELAGYPAFLNGSEGHHLPTPSGTMPKVC